MAKGPQLSVRLELDERILFEITSDQIDGEIIIGRGLDCTWQIPSSDRSASSHHAKIYRKGGKLMLTDIGSRNGVFFMGTRISEQKLSAGEIYGIGDSKLIVEECVLPVNGKKEQFHRLEQLSGENKGKIYQLVDPEISIGSATNCGIYIPDAHVSHMHAVFEQHNDGTCWIKDKGSRNGTKVNGVLLSKENAETGRMLKDGDVVSITYLEFKFWDKNVVHVRSNVFLKSLAVVATLAIVIGGYLIWQTLSPSSKVLRLKAERYAAAELFDAADQILSKAKDARGAEEDERQRAELLRKLEMWKHTFTTWNKIKDYLQQGEGADLKSANMTFQSLLTANNENWKWNTASAVEEMKSAQLTQELLNNLLTAEERLNASDDDMDRLANLTSNLEKNVNECIASSQPYRGYALMRANGVLAEMKLNLDEYGKLQKILASYSGPTETDKVVDAIAEIRKENETRVKSRKEQNLPASLYIGRYCGLLVEPVELLQKSNNILAANFDAVVKLDFSKYKTLLPLPTAEQSQAASQFAARASEMENANIQLGKIITQLKNYSRSFGLAGIYPENTSEILANLFNETVIENVMNCDCLNGKMPTFSTKEPTSDYDRMLGVNVFYEYLVSLDGDFDTSSFEERFEPELFKAKSLFSNLGSFNTFVSGNAKASFSSELARLNELAGEDTPYAKMKDTAKTLLMKRDGLVRQLFDAYEADAMNRRGIIAGGMAIVLKTDSHKFIGEDFKEKVHSSFLELRKELNNIANEKNGANVSVEKIMACDRKLLELAIPYDSLSKQAWTDKYNKK